MTCGEFRETHFPGKAVEDVPFEETTGRTSGPTGLVEKHVRIDSQVFGKGEEVEGDVSFCAEVFHNVSCPGVGTLGYTHIHMEDRNGVTQGVEDLRATQAILPSRYGHKDTVIGGEELIAFDEFPDP